MPDEITIQDLSKYRFSKAVEDWETAQDNYNNKKYRDCIFCKECI